MTVWMAKLMLPMAKADLSVLPNTSDTFAAGSNVTRTDVIAVLNDR